MKYSQDQIKEIFCNKKRNKYPKNRGAIKEALNRKTLEDLYLHQNKSLEDIAKEYNCTRPMVKHLMVQYGMERRTRGKARVLAIKEGKFENFEYHDINEEFFSNWTPAMAWVLGLLFTDGNIQHIANNRTALRVQISSVDLELLEKIAFLMKSSRPIRKFAQFYDNSKHIYRFEFYREKLREDLYKLGLEDNKSLVMRFPDVPD